MPAVLLAVVVDRGANYGSHIREGYRFVTFGQDMSVRSLKGFTVFELMVTVAIVAIISAFAIPGFQDMRVKGRISAAAEEVSSSLQLARNTAIVRRRTVLLVPYNGGWDTWMDAVTTGVRLSSHTVPAPVVLTAWQGSTVTDSVQRITFKTSGQVEKTLPATAAPLNMTIRICDSSVTNEVGADVTMSPIGRIAITRHSSKSVCNP